MTRDTEQVTIPAIVLDLDGTLLNPHHGLTAEAVAAVEHATTRGVRIILASGRSPSAVLYVQEQLGISGEWLIASQGAFVGRWTEQRKWLVLAETVIDPLQATAIENDAGALGLSAGRFCGDRWYVTEHDDSITFQAAITGMTPEPLPEDRLQDRTAPHKIQIGANSASDTQLLRSFGQSLPPSVTCTNSHDHLLEITRAGTDKAEGLTVLALHEGLNLDQIAAVGDGENDITLLKCVGTSVAMGNAGQEVRAAADWVTLDNAQDGAAVAIYDLLIPQGPRLRRRS